MDSRYEVKFEILGEMGSKSLRPYWAVRFCPTTSCAKMDRKKKKTGNNIS
jgi:hypothetical protein